MPLPFSKNQVRRLGERLRLADVPSEEDLDLLDTLLACYDDALEEVVDRIRTGLGLSATPRVKVTRTIMEKLKRSHRAHLGEIQDLAGARLAPEGLDRGAQDRLCHELVELFADGTRPPRVEDRRERPSEGYRAVHVVVFVQELPVEIQVRTPLQHSWAEYFEKLGDEWGRGIRYGEGPDLDMLMRRLDVPRQDREKARQDLTVSLAHHLSVVSELAELIDGFEQLPVDFRDSPPGARVAQRLQAILRRLAADDVSDLLGR